MHPNDSTELNLHSINYCKYIPIDIFVEVTSYNNNTVSNVSLTNNSKPTNNSIMIGDNEIL